MPSPWRAMLATGAMAVLAGCGGSSAGSGPDVIDQSQVQVATTKEAVEDGATVSTRLQDAGYTVIGSAPAGAGPGGFAVTFDGGGVVVVLVLDSAAQAATVAQGFGQGAASPDALVRQVGKHVYAANTAGAGQAVGKAEFDRLVAAAEGSGPG